MISIQEEYLNGGSRQYSIIGGSSCSFASFEWHISGITSLHPGGGDWIYSTNNIFIDPSPVNGNIVYVIVKQYIETYWNGGEFYGGNFSGNFGGGTFHYGQLNDCFYLKQEIKPKPFIEDINKPTGPQSVKPINTSLLL